MSMKNRALVFSDGSVGMEGDFPVAIVSMQKVTMPDGDAIDNQVTDPVFTDAIVNNLYGRIMTLVEATTETAKLKSVKDLFGKEISQWSSDVYSSAREIADGGNSSTNIYTRSR